MAYVKSCLQSMYNQWLPTSDDLCMQAEKKMFSVAGCEYKLYFVTTISGQKIRTVETMNTSTQVPLLLLHGFCTGVGLWTMNLAALSKSRKVYAIDLLGFGRSSRPQFSTDGAEIENNFVQSIEEWRKAVGLEKFILLGHGLGGYLAASYCISFPNPNCVRHLILADPWGIMEINPPEERNTNLPLWAKGIGALMSMFNPLASLRAAGPLGPFMLRTFRPDFNEKFSKVFGTGNTAVTEYIYHINAQQASGETAFSMLSLPSGGAKYPMIHRIGDIEDNLSISIVFGSRSWMDIEAGQSVQYVRSKSVVNLHIIKGAGHHLYVDKADEFNEYVSGIGDHIDASILNDTSQDVACGKTNTFGSLVVDV